MASLLHKVGETLGLAKKLEAHKHFKEDLDTTLVLTKGTIWTGEDLPSGGTKMVEGFAYSQSTGRILEVGSCEELIEKYNDFNTIDLRDLEAEDCFITPGFHDNHVHVMIGGHLRQGVSFEGITTRAGFIAKLEGYYLKWKLMDFAKRHHIKVRQSDKKGEDTEDWIIGAMMDQERLGRDLSKSVIDPIIKHDPVLVFSSDLHAAIANTVALKLCGIDRNTPDPSGGYIEKDDQGELTGMLRDSAIGLVQSHIPHHHMMSALFHSEEDISSVGVTSVSHMGAGPGMYVHQGSWEEMKRFNLALERKLHDIRIYAAVDLCSHSKLREAMDQEAPRDREFLKKGLLKSYMDGACGSATALIFEHYKGGKIDPEERHFPHGKRVVPLDELRRDIRAAIKEGLNVAVHAIGDRACHEIVEVYEEVVKENDYKLEPHRLRIEHLQHIKPKDLRRLAALKDCVSVCINPTHLLSGVEEFRELLRPGDEGEMRNLYRCRSILDAGLTVSFGSDWPIMSASPLIAIKSAIHRIPRDSKSGKPFLPEERITVEQALRCLTVNAAKMNGTSEYLGKIRPGFFADFTILDRNLLLNHKMKDLDNTKVLMTVMDGKIRNSAF